MKLLIFCIFCIIINSTLCASPKCFTIFHTTDVHGWIDGHIHTPEEDVTMGKWESFLLRAEPVINNSGCEMLVFDSGDLIEGTGISDSSPIHGQYIYSVYDMMPQYKAITFGNHDTEIPETVDYIVKQVVPRNPSRYVCSNLLTVDNKPVTQPYKILQTRQSRVLVLGMLYSFVLHAPNVHVQFVNESLASPWFDQAMKEAATCDFIVAVLHIGPIDPDLRLVYKMIRARYPEKPLFLLAGHDHTVQLEQWDKNCIMMETYCYMHSIGIIQFSLGTNNNLDIKKMDIQQASISYLTKFLNTTAAKLDTPQGLAIDSYIKQKSNELHLYDVIGCSASTYDQKLPPSYSNSIFSLIFKEIMPKVVYDKTRTNIQLGVINTPRLRAKLYSGKITINDIYALAPFNNSMWMIENVLGTHAIQMRQALPPQAVVLPKYVYSVDPLDANAVYDIIIPSYDVDRLLYALSVIAPNKYNKKQYHTAYTDTTMWFNYVAKYMKC